MTKKLIKIEFNDIIKTYFNIVNHSYKHHGKVYIDCKFTRKPLFL